MRKRIQAILLAAALLLPLAARGEFGTGGQMISPADLALVPEDRIVSRVRAACGNYSWSYAPKPYSEPDERIETSACGAAPLWIDCATAFAATRPCGAKLKLIVFAPACVGAP